MRSHVLVVPLAAVAFATGAAAQQTRVVTGTVTVSGAGTPLPDATITVAGGTAAARTNERGEFRISLPAGDAVLIIRALGYQRTTQRAPAGQASVTVSLVRDVLELDQVVVTGQSTTTERRNATTATAVVSAEEITRAPAPSIESSLQGKVIGANINMNSGAPGGGGQIQIRGITSILGQGDPLIVIDGVIMSNASFSTGINSVTGASRSGGVALQTSSQDNTTNRLSDINPNEIESLEVLKSAAATAIYGSRATNGVIVIRTKRGQAGATRVGVTQRIGTQNPLRLPGQRRFTSIDQALNAVTSAPETTMVRQLFANGTPAFQDFQKQLYGNKDLAYETLASVTGGTSSTLFRVAAGQKVDQGIALNTSARLQTMRAALTQTFSPRLTGEVGLNFIRNTFRRGISNNDNTGTSPLYIFGYTPSIVNLKDRDENGNFADNPFNCPTCSNPFETFALLNAVEDVYRGIGSYGVQWAALERGAHRLVVGANGGIDRFSQEGQIYSPGFLQYESQDGLLGTAVQRPVSGSNINNQIVATYTLAPTSGAYTATLSAGAAAEQQRTNALTLRGQGLLPGVGRANQGQQDLGQAYELFRDQAVFANAQISAFGDRLNLTTGLRADRSSANGDPAKFYVFPRVAGAYRLDTPFVPGVQSVKLRAGFGQTGNRPTYGARDVLLGVGSNLDGRATLIRGGAVGNPGIRPETLNEQEYGADVTGANNRFALEATYYDRSITNLLLQPATAPSTGFNSLFVNAGELQNRGVELGLTLVPVQTAALTWTARATYQSNKQEIVNLPRSVPPFNAPNSFGAAYGRNRVVSGAPTTAIWGNAPVSIANGQVTGILPVGTYVTNRLAVGGTRDTIIGDANPDFQMFFTNSVTLRRFSLSFLVDWRKGGDVANMTNNLFDEGRQSRDFDAPSPVDTLTLGRYRYLAWNGGTDARIYVQDGGFVKLREVSLGYDVPQSLVRRLGSRFSSLRVSAQGRNLAVWTDYWGAEPEVNNFGNVNMNRFIDLAVYPTPRQFFLSVDVGF